MELIITRINGKFRDYNEIKVPDGYCFYDKHEEIPQYITYMATPILDEQELRNRLVVVEGDADILNKEIEEENNGQS